MVDRAEPAGMALDRHVVGRVGKDGRAPVVTHQQLIGVFLNGTAAVNAMRSQFPEIARLRDWRTRWRGRGLVMLVRLRRNVLDQQIDLADLEAGYVQEFEVEFGELAQVFAEEALVPARVQGELVIGNPEGPDFLWAQVPNQSSWNFG